MHTEIQGGIDMSINIGASNAALLSAWNDAQQKRATQQQPNQKSSRQRAMEAFADAMRDCDEAMGNIVDEHHKRVAENAKRRDENNKIRAREERVQRAADERERLQELSAIKQFNLRNMLEEQRIDDSLRREMFDARG